MRVGWFFLYPCDDRNSPHHGCDLPCSHPSRHSTSAPLALWSPRPHTSPTARAQFCDSSLASSSTSTTRSTAPASTGTRSRSRRASAAALATRVLWRSVTRPCWPPTTRPRVLRILT